MLNDDEIARIETWLSDEGRQVESHQHVLRLLAHIRTKAAAERRLEAALRFYADPAANGATTIPDQYYELAFGDTAEAALTEGAKP